MVFGKRVWKGEKIKIVKNDKWKRKIKNDRFRKSKHNVLKLLYTLYLEGIRGKHTSEYILLYLSKHFGWRK